MTEKKKKTLTPLCKDNNEDVELILDVDPEENYTINQNFFTNNRGKIKGIYL